MIAFFGWLFYHANLLWVRLVVMIVSRPDIEGRTNVPRNGPLILVSNHLNNADPPVLTCATPRRIAWLTKMEWFSTPLIGPLLRLGGMIPVRRFEADLKALRRCQELLAAGGCLGVFPEGTRSQTGGMAEGEPGAAIIALRTGAPVQPVAIWGTAGVRMPRDFVRRPRVYVRFGTPFTLARGRRISRADVESGTRAIMASIAALLPEEHRGVFASEVSEGTERRRLASNP
jgi:1-acyl-sn-glycerol-3-phosphate acyltransferase